MTIEQAKRVRIVITLIEELKERLEIIKSPNVQFEIAFRLKGGMYDGYPFKVDANHFELTQKEIADFVTRKLEDKLASLTKELESYQPKMRKKLNEIEKIDRDLFLLNTLFNIVAAIGLIAALAGIIFIISQF